MAKSTFNGNAQEPVILTKTREVCVRLSRQLEFERKGYTKSPDQKIRCMSPTVDLVRMTKQVTK